MITMMEHNTDRLFWTISTIIVGALLLTIGVKAFPNSVGKVLQPMSGVIRSADDVQTAATKDNNEFNKYEKDNQAIKAVIQAQSQQIADYQQKLNDSLSKMNAINDQILALEADKTGENNAKAINDLRNSLSTTQNSISQYQNQIGNTNAEIQLLQSIQQNHSKNITDDENFIKQLQSALGNVVNSTNNAQNSANEANAAAQALGKSTLQYRGEWQGNYWDWDPHQDGIYSITGATGAPNGLPSNFTGWGTMILVTNASGSDKYGILYDNSGRVYTNHLFVNSSTFNGWIQTDGHGV